MSRDLFVYRTQHPEAFGLLERGTKHTAGPRALRDGRASA